MADKVHWISDAIRHPGSLTKAAKSAGKTIQGYCASSKLSAHREKQCDLAHTLREMPKK